MFENPRYVTYGIHTTLPPVVIIFLWNLIEARRRSGQEIDYLQVFNLYAAADGYNRPIQVIWHSQEEPLYNALYTIELPDRGIIKATIYAIDDGFHSTMLLAEEY